ncbi:hypothetical protein HDU88_007869 [Geranomyces variabilis]|nr:hypothetical protein HDU88_007869 [Geranomyces variabilis]
MRDNRKLHFRVINRTSCPLSHGDILTARTSDPHHSHSNAWQRDIGPHESQSPFSGVVRASDLNAIRYSLEPIKAEICVQFTMDSNVDRKDALAARVYVGKMDGDNGRHTDHLERLEAAMVRQGPPSAHPRAELTLGPFTYSVEARMSEEIWPCLDITVECGCEEWIGDYIGEAVNS